MSVTFRTHLLSTDVAAVRFVENFVVIGVGGCIKIFNSTTSELVLTQEIFHGQKIHGIELGPNSRIAVHGGKMVAHFIFNSRNNIHVSDPIIWKHNDWILHLRWLNDNTLAMVTAHNVVSLWNPTRAKKIKTVTCNERCIIYSALIDGPTWNELVVFAGTVFQEVVIWTVGQDQYEDRPVLHRLKGHNGVIFSIFFDSATRRISTTSDDRSVRLWSVTGDDWPSANITLQHTLFGHRARVWRSVILRDIVISIGEDSQLCIWSDGGQLLRRWNTHQGGKIWSLDFNLQHGLIATGGGDGGVSLWPLRNWSEVSLTPKVVPFPSNLVPRRIALAMYNLTVAVTDSGSILYRSTDRNDWIEVYQSDRLASYCLLELSPCKQRVAFAAIDGTLLIYLVVDQLNECQMNKIIDINVVGSKIFSLQWLTSECLLVCSSNGNMEMWQFVNESKLIKISEFLLPPSREQWISDAVLVGGVLVCGDRNGSLHVYKQSSDDVPQSPRQSLHRIHGRLGVCSLSWHGKRLISTGRDGTVRQYSIQEETLKLNSTDKVPMVWVTSVVESSSGLLILGFCEVNFVVWSWKEQRTILEVECGGGHRSWDFRLEADNVFHFVYVKDKMVNSLSCSLDQLVKPVLQTGFHTKEVGCIQPLLCLGSQNHIVISGSEDTTIRISSAIRPNQLDTVAILRGHISSVRALAIETIAFNKTLLFSAGGRAQMKVWLVTSEGSPNTDEVEVVTCQELTSHMLREQGRRPWRVAAAEPAADPETRYMDLCTYQQDKDRITVIAGCSDGLLRLFTYEVSRQTLHLVAEYSHHNRCILKVTNLTLQSNTHIILSMSTDGQCAFWMFSQKEEQKPFATMKLHQSGINSFDCLEVERNKFLLATGGDDNAMVITLLRIEVHPKMAVENLAQTQIGSMHAAQITGLKFTGSNYLVSACIDQRIRVWRWTYASNNNTLACTLVNERYTTVSDVQGLQLWGTRKSITACVHGKGVEVIDIGFEL